MTIDSEPNRRPIKRTLQIISAVSLALSALPCILAFVNIPSAIQFAVQTGGNAALQIYIPLVVAGLINGFGLVVLIISLTIKETPTTPTRFTHYQ
jgi:VIT1/CCC1 family predicted Fe2+/Mn2+ transporter